jgi:hypothetical protein
VTARPDDVLGHLSPEERDSYRRAARVGPYATDNEVAASSDLLANLRDGVWLSGQVFPPLVFAVFGILAEGFSLFVGPPKIGKSWTLLDWLLAVAAGGSALGYIDIAEPRHVLYLALEDSDRRLQDRAQKLLGDLSIPGTFHYLTRVEPGRILETVRAWLERFSRPGSLVAIDTLGKVMPPAMSGESQYQRDYRIGAALKRVVDDFPGVSLVVAHHDRKAGSDDFVDSVSGTHGLAGSADSILVLVRNRNETNGVLRVTGRDVTEAEYALRVVDGFRWQLDGTNLEDAARNATERRAVEGLADRTRDVLQFVQSNNGVSPKQVAEALGLDGGTIRQYLSRLLQSGRIAKSGRGTYTPVATVASVAFLNERRDNATRATPHFEGRDE